MTRVSTRAWVVWTVGVAAYVIAVLHRTSLGVAGIDAQRHFDIGASALASFAVLQLLVYAGLQVPAGILLDRFGSLRLIVAGALIMAAGHTLLAFTDGVGGAVSARVLVGAGDALTFISVLRLVPQWFPGRRVPLLTQLTGIVGQLGQILSAVPLAALLAVSGWTTAFVGTAAAGVFVAVIALVALHDSPHERVSTGASASMRQVGADLSSAWRHPGTRLGLWSHFTTQFTGTVFALMWGFPFLVAGEGVDRGTASVLLTVFVLTGMATGPLMGVLAQRYPLRRSLVVLGVVFATTAAWTLVLLWPGQAPLPVLVLLVVALGLGGPASIIGFDFARTFNPASRLGTATGIVNAGGFFAALVTILLVGLILDFRTGGTPDYALTDFKVALSVQFLVGLIGLVGILRTRRLARRRLADEQGVVVRPIHRVLIERGTARRRRSRRPVPVRLAEAPAAAATRPDAAARRRASLRFAARPGRTDVPAVTRRTSEGDAAGQPSAD